ncbi:hypothetical protein BGW39_004404 [Mortierella sp. 14UC]|nr:hypothetical protein BGW39_004404 [Mortierella sp. 14UC]
MRISTPATLLLAALPLMAAAQDPSNNWTDFLTSCQTPGQIALTFISISQRRSFRGNNGDAPDSQGSSGQSDLLHQRDMTSIYAVRRSDPPRLHGQPSHRHDIPPALDTTKGMTNNEIKEDIGRASRTIQDLIGVYPKYMKIDVVSLKERRLLDIVKSMGYTLVGFNLDEYDYKYNTINKAGQIAEVYNSVFSKQQEAYGRKASYIITGYDVPTTGAAAALPKVVNTINARGYDMVRLDGCTNDKTPYKKDPLQEGPLTRRTPYKKDPIKDNGYVGDSKSFGAQEYKHGQVNVNANNYSPSADKGGADGAGKGTTGGDHLSSATKMTAVVSTSLVVPAVLCSHFL